MTEFFSVHDAAMAAFVDPFSASTLEVALRGFREQCETPDTQFAKFPEDYSLWHVGSFDSETGMVAGITPIKVAMATSFVASGTIARIREDMIQVDDPNGVYHDREVGRS